MATYTQADLDAITAAIATGATSVTIGDRTVNYRSLPQMRAVRAEIEAALGLVPADQVRRNPWTTKAMVVRGE